MPSTSCVLAVHYEVGLIAVVPALVWAAGFFPVNEDNAKTDPVWMGLATGLTLSEVSVAGLLGIRESSSYSFGSGMGVC